MRVACSERLIFDPGGIVDVKPFGAETGSTLQVVGFFGTS
jgi:hypothetical protein